MPYAKKKQIPVLPQRGAGKQPDLQSHEQNAKKLIIKPAG